MTRPSPLDDPAKAANAWARYRRLMRWMVGGAALAILLVLGALRYSLGEAVNIHFMIATALGTGFSVMLAAALMGLVFLSAGSGHDEAIEDPFEDLVDPQ